ncbi:hypothetical protein SAMN05443662_0160 [Sulfurivirga caldicuralii]|uniref:Probable membrane transporter protein n=1 Tax=Sulfurivirga caldicuralii TaxID=364032 RepID=A0A1N6DHU8_9GAMM|nr:sulfite exporter TauE/SafE family protein [Sulfurivirga caldicuralii]SIN70375.1 hypothetical protein SAMN05443662_0160 [Sulfurivirga caldicuralii]
MIIELGVYLLTGAVVGFMAGLFGVGGGLIVVPVLTSVFAWYLDTPHIVHLAIGTSLATILVTSLASVRAHHGHGAVRWDLVKQLSAGIFLGGFLGGWGSQFVPSKELAIVFAVMEIFIAINFILALQPKPHRTLPGPVGNFFAGVVIGFLASLVGIGGGTLTTPYLVWHNISLHEAIATSAACSLPVAAAGTLGYLLGGMHATDIPPFATGYIYWPAFLGIVAASSLTAKYGARLAHRLPPKPLKRALGVLLLLLAGKMIFFAHA